MKKPHEQEWKTRDGHFVTGEAGFQIALCDRKADAKLIAAAPKMARALLAQGYVNAAGEWHTSSCSVASSVVHGTHSAQCEAARAALREAGVLEGP